MSDLELLKLIEEEAPPAGTGGAEATPSETPEPEASPTKKEDGQEPSKTVDTLKGVVRGPIKGVGQTIDFILESVNFMEERSGFQDFTSSIGLTGPEGFLPDDATYNLAENTLTAPFDKYIGAPETGVGNFAQGVASFAVPFGAAGKAGKGLKYLSKSGKLSQNVAKLSKLNTSLRAAAKGAIADNVIFEEADKNLSNLIEDLNPDLKDSYLTALAIDENDSQAVKRFKMTLEGAGVGFAADYLLGLAKFKKGIDGADTDVSPAKTAQTIGPDGRAKEVRVVDTVSNARKELVKNKHLTADEADHLTEQVFEEAAESRAKAALTMPEVMNDQEFIAKEVKAILSKNKQVGKEVFNNIQKHIELLSKKTEGDIRKELDKSLLGDVPKQASRSFDEIRKNIEGLSSAEVKAQYGMKSEELFKEAQLRDHFFSQLVDASARMLNAKGTSSAREIALEVDFLTKIVREKTEAISNISSEAGRTLRSTREVYANTNAVQRASILRAKVKGFNDEDLVALSQVAELVTKNSSAADKFLKKGNLGRATALMYDALVTNYLSRPSTHALNISANSSFLAFNSAAKSLQKYVLKGTPAEKEAAGAFLKGIFNGDNISSAFKNARTSFATGQVSSGLNPKIAPEIEDAFGIAVRDTSLGDLPVLHHMFKFASGVSRTVRGGLAAGDSFFRTLIVDAKLRENYVLKHLDDNMSPEQIRKEMEAYSLMHWDKVSDDVLIDSIDSALKEADDLTLMADLNDNSVYNLIDKMSNFAPKTGPLQDVKLLSPFGLFARVGVNQMVNVARYTPGLHVFTDTQRILQSGTNAQVQQVKSRMLAASALIMTSSYLGREGLVVTNLSTDPKEAKIQRQQGMKPYSVKVGNKYVPMKFLGVPGAFMILGAALGKVSTNIEAYLGDEMPENASLRAEVGTVLGMALMESMVPAMLTQSFPDLFGALEEASRTGESKKFDRLIGNMAANIIPGKVAMSEVFKLSKVALGDDIKKFDVSNIESLVVQDLARSFPELANVFGAGVYPDVGIFGNDVDGSLLPEAQNADVFLELQKIDFQNTARVRTEEGETNLNLYAPNRRGFSVAGTKVDLTGEQFYKLKKYISGRDVNGEVHPQAPMGKTFLEAIREEIDGGWPSVFRGQVGEDPTNEAKRVYVKQLRRMYSDFGRAVLKAEIVQSPDFRNTVEKNRERTKKNLGITIR